MSRNKKRHFSDGGKLSEADRLMAEMAAKYGVSAAPSAQPVKPVPQATPQPTRNAEQKPAGLLDSARAIFGNRAKQIDKAAGYAGGGKIAGPGAATSDSIPATIRETGEEIRVSNGERILSAAQDQFLQSVAKGAGYESLDAMLEDATGKPVGPTIKAGKRAAEDGKPPELDPFAYRGPKVEDSKRVAVAIAAPPTLGGAPLARTEPAGGALSGPASGITAFGPKPAPVGSGLMIDPSKPNPDTGFVTGPAPGIAPDPVTKPGRNAAGVITDETAKAALGADMQRSGGVFGTANLAEQNERMARSLGYAGVDDFNRAWRDRPVAVSYIPEDSGGSNDPSEIVSKMSDAMHNAGTRTARAAIGQAMNTMLNNAVQQRGQNLNYAAEMARQGITSRGIDLRNDLARNEQAAIDRRATDRLDATLRGQDLRAEAVDKRIASGAERRGMPTMSQASRNAEIDAARERIAGMDPAEIKRRTANYTATGRENPDFDPTLAKAVSLAGRRKIGDDPHFDERQPRQAGQHGYDRNEVASRFRAERGMDRYKLGNDTADGVEVLDAAGKVVGHYR